MRVPARAFVCLLACLTFECVFAWPNECLLVLVSVCACALCGAAAKLVLPVRVSKFKCVLQEVRARARGPRRAHIGRPARAHARAGGGRGGLCLRQCGAQRRQTPQSVQRTHTSCASAYAFEKLPARAPVPGAASINKRLRTPTQQRQTGRQAHRQRPPPPTLGEETAARTEAHLIAHTCERRRRRRGQLPRSGLLRIAGRPTN